MAEQCLRYLGNFVLVPIVGHYGDANTEFLFLAFLNVMLIAYLVDAGLGRFYVRTFSNRNMADRTVSFEFSTSLGNKKKSSKNEFELDLIFSSLTNIQAVLAVFGGLIAGTLISFYATLQANISLSDQPLLPVLVALVVTAQVLNIGLGAFLQGFDEIHRQKSLELTFTILRIAIAGIVAFLGGSLSLILVVYFVSLASLDALYLLRLSRRFGVRARPFLISRKVFSAIVPIVWRQASLSWASYILLSLPGYIAAWQLDVGLASKFMFSFMIFQGIASIARIGTLIYYPRIARAVFQRDGSAVLRFVWRCKILGLGIFLCGVVALVFLRSLHPLNIIGGTGLALLALSTLLELNHSISASIYITTGHNPFHLMAWISILLISIFTWLFLPIKSEVTIIILFMAAQAAVNNWLPDLILWRFVRSI